MLVMTCGTPRSTLLIYVVVSDTDRPRFFDYCTPLDCHRIFTLLFVVLIRDYV